MKFTLTELIGAGIGLAAMPLLDGLAAYLKINPFILFLLVMIALMIFGVFTIEIVFTIGAAIRRRRERRRLRGRPYTWLKLVDVSKDPDDPDHIRYIQLYKDM